MAGGARLVAKARVKLAPPWPSLCHEERSGGKRANGESGGSSAATVQAQGAGALLALRPKNSHPKQSPPATRHSAAVVVCNKLYSVNVGKTKPTKPLGKTKPSRVGHAVLRCPVLIIHAPPPTLFRTAARHVDFSAR